jgi:hypothetical protein
VDSRRARAAARKKRATFQLAHLGLLEFRKTLGRDAAAAVSPSRDARGSAWILLKKVGYKIPKINTQFVARLKIEDFLCSAIPVSHDRTLWLGVESYERSDSGRGADRPESL